MPHTPSSERATTRKPETAPPRMAVWTAPTRLVWAAAAVGTLARTLTHMPMMPATIEQAAPTRKAKPVRMPSSTPKTCVSATSSVSTTAMMAATTSVPTTASRAMVEYWRLMKALAPSWMVLPDLLHRLGALVARQHVTGQPDREEDRRDPGDRDDPDGDVRHGLRVPPSWNGLAGRGDGRDGAGRGHVLPRPTASGRRRVSHPRSRRDAGRAAPSGSGHRSRECCAFGSGSGGEVSPRRSRRRRRARSRAARRRRTRAPAPRPRSPGCPRRARGSCRSRGPGRRGSSRGPPRADGWRR